MGKTVFLVYEEDHSNISVMKRHNGIFESCEIVHYNDVVIVNSYKEGDELLADVMDGLISSIIAEIKSFITENDHNVIIIGFPLTLRQLFQECTLEVYSVLKNDSNESSSNKINSRLLEIEVVEKFYDFNTALDFIEENISKDLTLQKKDPTAKDSNKLQRIPLAVEHVRKLSKLRGDIKYYRPNSKEAAAAYSKEELKYLASREKFSKPYSDTMYSSDESFEDMYNRISPLLADHKDWFTEKELDKLDKPFHRVNPNVGAIRGDLSTENRFSNITFFLIAEHEALLLRERMLKNYYATEDGIISSSSFTAIRKSSNIGAPSFSYSAKEKREAITMFKENFGMDFNDDDLRTMMQAFRDQGKASSKFTDKVMLVGGTVLSYLQGTISLEEMAFGVSQTTYEVALDFKSKEQGHLRSITIAPFKFGLLVLGQVTLLREAFHEKDGYNNHRVGKQWDVRLKMFGRAALLTDYRDNDTKLSTEDMFQFIGLFYPYEAERLKKILSNLRYIGVDWLNNEEAVYYVLEGIKPANASGILFLTAIANYFIHSTANLTELIIKMHDKVDITTPNAEFSKLIRLVKASGKVVNNSDDVMIAVDAFNITAKGPILKPQFDRKFGEASIESDAVGQTGGRDDQHVINAIGRPLFSMLDVHSKWERRSFNNKLRGDLTRALHGSFTNGLAQLMSLQGYNRSKLEEILDFLNKFYNVNFSLDDLYLKEYTFLDKENDTTKIAMEKAMSILNVSQDKLFYALKSDEIKSLPDEIIDELWILEDTNDLISHDSISALHQLNKDSIWIDDIVEEEVDTVEFPDGGIFPELGFRIELTHFSKFKDSEEWKIWTDLGKFGFEPAVVNSVFWRLLSHSSKNGKDLQLGLLSPQGDYNHYLFLIKNYGFIDESYFITEDDVVNEKFREYIDINGHNSIVSKLIADQDDIYKKHLYSQEFRSDPLYKEWMSVYEISDALEWLKGSDLQCESQCDLVNEITGMIDLSVCDHRTRSKIITQMVMNSKHQIAFKIDAWKLGLPQKK